MSSNKPVSLPNTLDFDRFTGLTFNQIPRPIAVNHLILRNDMFQMSLYASRTAGEAVLFAAKGMEAIGGPFASGLCQPLKTLAVQHKQERRKDDPNQQDIASLLTSLMLTWAFSHGEDKVPYVATAYPVESVQVHLRDEVPKKLESCVPSEDVEAAMFMERVHWLHQHQVHKHTTHLNRRRQELLGYIIGALEQQLDKK